MMLSGRSVSAEKGLKLCIYIDSLYSRFQVLIRTHKFQSDFAMIWAVKLNIKIYTSMWCYSPCSAENHSCNMGVGVGGLIFSGYIVCSVDLLCLVNAGRRPLSLVSHAFTFEHKESSWSIKYRFKMFYFGHRQIKISKASYILHFHCFK